MSIALLLIHNAKSLLPTTSPLPCLSARGGHATTSSVSSSASACRQCSDKHHHRHQGIHPRKREHFCGPLRLLQRLGTERTRGEHWSNLERSGVYWKPKGAAADSYTPTWRRMSMQFMPAWVQQARPKHGANAGSRPVERQEDTGTQTSVRPGWACTPCRTRQICPSSSSQ